MNIKPTIVGLVSGIALTIIYVLKSLISKKHPALSIAVRIIMSSVALITACDFGSVALFSSSEYLGNFNEHRLIMILGSLAVIWISIDFLYHQIFSDKDKQE